MKNPNILKKGQILLTKPEKDFWGVAVVLSEREKTSDRLAVCHIAITPLIYNFKPCIEDIDFDLLKPLRFKRLYKLKDKEEFVREEICIGVYTRRNKINLEAVGQIDPIKVYNGPLPFDPIVDLEIKWPLCGDPIENFGREAYLTWTEKQK
jgi:hypothetical protein